jgi:S-DNA-T family DNA segregation ATPase FtsK/SpoIIIE
MKQEYIGQMLKDLFSIAFPLSVFAVTTGLLILLGSPKDSLIITEDLLSIGFTNKAGEPPLVIDISTEWVDYYCITKYLFVVHGLPLEYWETNRAALSSALNVHIVNIMQGVDNQHIVLLAVPATRHLPSVIPWSDSYIDSSISIFVIGESLLGRVSVDLSKIPHILVGGTTGSGKTVLIRNLIYQAIKKGAKVIVADFKGVDFGTAWRQRCRVILDEDLLISALKSVIDEMNIRRNVLQSEDMPNIFEYNRIFGFRYNHIIVAVDEVGELLDKTGAPKDRREAISTIENCLSTIARQGRAFGINLILGTQRPDANILSGQIKNNIDCRICGRADNVLSQIVLDTTDANDLIPKDSRGRFLMNDGTIFQGYLFEDNEF